MIEIVIEIDVVIVGSGRWEAIGIDVVTVVVGTIEIVIEIVIEIEGAVVGRETPWVVAIGVVTRELLVGIEAGEEVAGIGKMVPVGTVRRKQEKQ